MNKDEAIDILKKGVAIGNFVTIDWVETEIATKTVLNYIEKLENKLDKQKQLTKLAETITDESIKEALIEFEKDYIPKQKLRDKIEELEEEDLEIYDTDSEDLIIAKYEQRAVLDFAQQLLNDKEEK